MNLKNYEYVVSIKKIGKLPFYENINHAIETTTEPSYGPL